MFSRNKNSYLQSRTDPPANIINRCVRQAWLNLTEHGVQPVDSNPEYNRLTSQQPAIPMRHVDITRRPLAFGRLKVRELRRELHSSDTNLKLASLNSFCDIMHDPEIAYEAIRLQVPDRLADLLLHESSEVRERVCLALMIMAGAGDGSVAIVNNRDIIAGLKMAVDDVEGHVRSKAAMLIDRVCLLWTAADVLTEYGFIEILIDCVIKDAPEIVAVHFKSLESMFYCERGRLIAFENKFFEILVDFIKTAPDMILPGALRSLGNLLVIPEAKILAIELNLIEQLAKLIHHKNPAISNATAFALMFGTVKMRAKLQAFQYDDLPGRLVELANNWQNEESQTYCIKALTNLCEYPPLRLKVYKAHLKEIDGIQAKDSDVRKYKELLVELVYAVSNLEQEIFMVDESENISSDTIKSELSAITWGSSNTSSFYLADYKF